MIRGLVAALEVIAALVALSWAVVAADRAAMRADTVRLALWRLDAEANALILTETARPVNEWPRPQVTPPILSRQILNPGQQSASAPAEKTTTDAIRNEPERDQPQREAAPAATITQATKSPRCHHQLEWFIRLCQTSAEFGAGAKRESESRCHSHPGRRANHPLVG